MAETTITIKQGETFKRSLTFQNVAGEPMDVSEWEFTGQLRRRYDSRDILASFTFDTTDAATGVVVMKLTAAETTAIKVHKSSDYRRTPTRYIYDVEAVKPDDEVLRCLEGTAEISPEVTKEEEEEEEE